MTDNYKAYVSIIVNNNQLNPPYRPNMSTRFDTPKKISFDKIRQYISDTEDMLINKQIFLPEPQCVKMITLHYEDTKTFGFFDKISSDKNNHWRGLTATPIKLEVEIIRQEDCLCGDDCAKNMATGKCKDKLIKHLVCIPLLPELYKENQGRVK